MKPGRILILLAIVLVGIVIYINKCNKGNKDQSMGPGNPKGNQAVTVSGYVISTTPFEERIFSSGSVLASEEVTLTNEIPGRITAISFKEGSHVRKGELLVKLYDVDIRAQLKK